LLLESFFVSNSCPTALARYPLDQSYSPQGIYAAPTPRPGCSGFGLRGFTWPGWSPDGTQIVIHEYSFQTYVLSRDGATKRPLAEGGQPDWSPDGSAIVYAAGPLQGATLHLIHPSGSSDRRLTSPAPNEADGCPAWSPDGSKVAFVRLGHAPDGSVTSVHAYVVDRDGTNERQLAVLPGEAVANLPGTTNVVHPAWSADGLHLAYSGYVGTYIVKVDGTGFRQVSEAPAFYPAQWRPRAPRE
jgi:Tol biopolymer transport system component